MFVCFFWPVYGFIDRTDCDMTVNRMREREEWHTAKRPRPGFKPSATAERAKPPYMRRPLYKLSQMAPQNYKFNFKRGKLIFTLDATFFKILSPFGSLSPGRLQRMSSASLWDVFSARRINTRVLLSRSAGSQGHELELRNHWFSESTDGKSKHKKCQGPFPNKQTNTHTRKKLGGCVQCK